MIGYLRVSTREQAEDGHGLDAQRHAIERYAAGKGWQMRWISDEGFSAKTMKRPGLQEALTLLENHEEPGLVVAKLDRLSRSVVDFAQMMALAREQEWAIVAIDLGVDTGTPAGEMVATVMSALAQWERRMIGLRTKEGLAAARAKGKKLGRPSKMPPAVVDYVCQVFAATGNYTATARQLTEEGVKTGQGAKQWYAGVVRDIVLRNSGLALRKMDRENHESEKAAPPV